MRIVIDLQGAQGAAIHRGIGRYSLSLAQAIVRNKGEHEVILAASGFFPETIEPIRAAFDGILPQTQIRVWQASGPVRHTLPVNVWRRKASELLRESFLASLRPDIVLITSLFEAWGWGDDAITSIGLLTQSVPVAVSFYDLIPLINRSTYLGDREVAAWYENKLDQLRRASLLLAISESSRRESIKYIGFPDNRSINVGTAADPQFRCIHVSFASEQSVREHYALSRQFVMYTGGIDHRKNIEGLIRAYALLPGQLRRKHQLAIVCSVQVESRCLIEELVRQQGLDADEVVLTGFVPEEDLLVLYNLCKAFVFPSLHEGFGLPALEAMSCGAAVIGSNTSSIPEVIGREDALFDPHDFSAISKKLAQVLTDDTYHAELVRHGLEQAKRFSWDKSAKSAITAFERFLTTKREPHQHASTTNHRPTLAYVSPLPPERSGIADYSAELLPELSRHYQIDVIVAQDSVADVWINEICNVRSVEWFVRNAHRYDRVLYHFGNSTFHTHMFELLKRIPGVVVLHDFFLGHITSHIDESPRNHNFLHRTLYHSHGYKALVERYHGDGGDWAWKYPCNKPVIDDAIGIIVHSNHSRQLAESWLGLSIAAAWSVIPLLRALPVAHERTEARGILGISEDAFVVCSFGMLGPSKQNLRLLDAWFASKLSKDDRCFLVFVGENPASGYGAQVTAAIHKSDLSDRIRITGWINPVLFRHYLAAADVGVQLRCQSRGETSAAVLDCMNYGLPTIVNANGSMAELSADAVFRIQDNFDDSELVFALETLRENETKRSALRIHARSAIFAQHAPRICGDQYALAIEEFYRKAQSGKKGLMDAVARIEGAPSDAHEWLALANGIAQSIPAPSERQLLVDISELVQRDAKSGIQRVVRSVISALLGNPPKGFRVEPVYATPDVVGYRYARHFTHRLLKCPVEVLADEPIEILNGDIFIGLDLQPHIVPQQADYFAYLKRMGAQVYFVVYDLLPVLLPKAFPEGASANFTAWLRTIAQGDGVICISRAVADEMTEWLTVHSPMRHRPFNLGWFHLGADVGGSVPTTGLPADASNVCDSLSRRPTFLMVGTIEPRKAQGQALAAFERLWDQNVDVNLVMVGKQGWMIDTLIDSISNHPEQNRRLFWLAGISDEYLEKVYASSICLIVASEGEGFGLPIIEATQHKLPVIARDIPVFREVAGEHAHYFSGSDPSALADAVKDWLILNHKGIAPQSHKMHWLTWSESTEQLMDVILNDHWMTRWTPDGAHRYCGSDERLGSQVGARSGLRISTTGVSGYLIYGPYLQLTAGHYQVRVHGLVTRLGLPKAYADVATSQGTDVHASSILSVSLVDTVLAEMEVDLKLIVTDLEVRLWVAADSELSISKLEIIPAAVLGRTATGPLA
jgi:glycosyltransferase involved in cell wall biosynthesis